MTKDNIRSLIAEGYSILKNGDPLKIEGDLWEYLEKLDEEDTSILVLEDLLKWNDEDLKKVAQAN